MDAQQKLASGAALATIAGLGMVLSSISGWPSVAHPWGLLVVFALGVLGGIGATLAVSGLMERRQAP